MTQEAVAEELGVSQSYVAKYEGGERRLDVLEFVAVARAVGADAAELLREMIAEEPVEAAAPAKPGRRGKKTGG